jgi:hypothetical protein
MNGGLRIQRTEPSHTELEHDAVCSSETSVYFNETKRRYIPENCRHLLGHNSCVGLNLGRPTSALPAALSALSTVYSKFIAGPELFNIQLLSLLVTRKS